MPDKKGRPTWAEMSSGQRVGFVFILIVIFGVTAGMIWWMDSAGKSPNDKAARTTIKQTGTATSEARVGDDVIWTATVTNTGSVAIPNLRANTNFGGLELRSIEPEPVAHEVAMIQDFGPVLPRGPRFDVSTVISITSGSMITSA